MKPFRYSFFVSILLCGLCLGVGWYWGRWSMRSESSTVSTHAATERSLDSSTAKNGVSSPQIAENESPANSGQIDFTPGPDELLQAAGKIQDKASRQLYLRTLLRHWIENDPSYPEELKAKFLAGLPPGPGMQHVGLEVQFARFAAMLRDSAIGDAWKLAFASHPARSEIFAQFLAMDLANSSPEELFGNSRDWNLWEQDRYNGQLLRAWAGVEPNHAYAWYLAHPSLFGSDAEAVVFEAWAEQDFEELSAHMNSLQDPDARARALEALAKHMAHTNTDSALDWANSLANEADQEYAHELIYQETPRGIGAILNTEDGFPQVVEPLVSNGLQSGDLLIGARNGDQQTEFFGKDLRSAVDVLLGAPGTDVTLQVLRADPQTGELHQVELIITRQQLWLEGDKEP